MPVSATEEHRKRDDSDVHDSALPVLARKAGLPTDAADLMANTFPSNALLIAGKVDSFLSDLSND